MVTIDLIWHSSVFVVTCLALFVLAVLTFKAFNRSINIRKELTEKDNLAFFLAYIGYFVALLFVIAGVMLSDSNAGFWVEILYTLMYGSIAILALNLAVIYTDVVIYPRIVLWTEIINNKKISVGLLKGVNFVSIGILISGVLLTEVDRPFQAILYFVLALLLSSLGFIYYNLITPFNCREEIDKGNIAVAMAAGGAQIAFAILIYAGFQIQHSSWKESLLHIVVDIVLGFILIPVVRFIVDKIFLIDRSLKEELIEQKTPNMGAGLFEACAYIGASLIVIWCYNL